MLRRSRLLDHLHEHIDRQLQFVCAGAGYGKTTLLASFAHESDLTTCWYSLDPADCDLSVFVHYLLACLERPFPGFGRRTRQLLETSIAFDEHSRELVGLLVNEMVERIPEWFVLILDDFQYVEESPAVQAFLSTFFEYQPEHCRLIVASRTIPSSAVVSNLLARGRAVGLTQVDLCFTLPEVRAVLAQGWDDELTEEEITWLAAGSEGWITGILLTHQALRPDLLRSIARIRHSGQPLYDYLAGEVLERQEPAMSRFLLASSTLDEMSAPLCQEALGLEGAREMLFQLERRNLFTTCVADGALSCYRYHSLFREFLQARLRENDCADFCQLHDRAARWFERQNKVDTAIGHFLCAGEPAEAARVLDGVAHHLVSSGRLVTLANWAAQLSEETIRARPRLSLWTAKAFLATGNVEQHARWLAWAEEAAQRENDGTLCALACAARAQAAIRSGELGAALNWAQQALALSTDVEASVEAHRFLAIALIRLGRADEAEQHLQHALEQNSQLNDLHREVLILTGLAHSLHARGRIPEASRVAQAAVATARRLGSPGYLAEALNDSGNYLYALGDFAAAFQSLQESLQAARQAGHPPIEAYSLVSLGMLLRDLGQREQALDLLSRGYRRAIEVGNIPLSVDAQEGLAWTHLQLAKDGQAEDAARIAFALAQKQQSSRLQNRSRATLAFVQAWGQAGTAGSDELCAVQRELEERELLDEIPWVQALQAVLRYRDGQRQDAVRLLQSAVVSDGLCSPDPLLLLGLEQGAALWAEVAQGSDNGGRESTRLHEWQALAEQARQFGQLVGTARPPLRPVFRFSAFGHGLVERDGQPVAADAWQTDTALYLLFYLLLHSGRSREEIGAALWPDLRPERLAGTFHNTKYRTQRALGLAPFVLQDGLYTISTELDYQFDVAEFQQLVRQARQLPPVKAARCLARAVDLYRDDFLLGCDHDWCIEWRESLQQQFLEAVTHLSTWLVEHGHFERAIELLQRGLRCDPLREDFYRQLMRALALQGRQDEALAHYRRCCRVLERDLGLPPASETAALARQIRRGEVVSKRRAIQLGGSEKTATE